MRKNAPFPISIYKKKQQKFWGVAQLCSSRDLCPVGRGTPSRDTPSLVDAAVIIPGATQLSHPRAELSTRIYILVFC